MIQIRRGTTASWKKLKKALDPGQPGYDKTKHKLKIGDGSTPWEDLPDATGLFQYEIVASEESAQNRLRLDDEATTLITYGTANPSSTTAGKIYLQQYDGSVEADYVVEFGRNLNYFYRKWESGFMELWGNGDVPDTVDELFTTVIYSTNTVLGNKYYERKGFWKN